MKLVLALLLAACCAPAQIVEGTVVNLLTGGPVSGVRVVLKKDGAAVYQDETDERGKFHLEDVADGRYTVQFLRRGFVDPKENWPEETQVRVAAGEGPVRVDKKLTPGGSISGRVLNGEGEPVPQCQVRLTQAGEPAQESTSNQRGEFSFPEVLPGSYLLTAFPLHRPSGWEWLLAWLPTYFPDSLDRRGATKLVVRPGIAMEGQDIRLRTAPARLVTGTAIDPEGRPSPGALVKAIPTDPNHFDVRGTGMLEEGFLFSLYEGEWIVTAESRDGKLRGYTTVRIGREDPERVKIRLAPPFTVRAIVEFDKPPAKSERQDAFVFLAPAYGVERPRQGSGAGELQIDDVFAGAYRVISRAPPAVRYYLASITLGDVDVMGRVIEITPGTPPIHVVYRNDGGGVRGTVTDCGAATVLLVPQDRTLHEPQFVQRAACDKDRFEFSNVRPGDYYAFVFDRLEPTQSFLDGFDQAMANLGTAIHVRSSEVATVELRVLARASQ